MRRRNLLKVPIMVRLLTFKYYYLSFYISIRLRKDLYVDLPHGLSRHDFPQVLIELPWGNDFANKFTCRS